MVGVQPSGNFSGGWFAAPWLPTRCIKSLSTEPETVIYPDHNATTLILPGVREAMLPYLAVEWGNPSSTYRFGSRLKAVLENAGPSGGPAGSHESTRDPFHG